jgi:hypothetical protein
MRHVAVNVQEAVVPQSGHWLMEESPVYTVSLVRKFLESAAPATSTPASVESDSGEKRLALSEFEFPQLGNPGTGSSGVSGIQTRSPQGGLE